MNKEQELVVRYTLGYTLWLLYGYTLGVPPRPRNILTPGSVYVYILGYTERLAPEVDE